MNTFLQVNKDYLYSENNFKLIDIIILSQIEEFDRNCRECYMTNEQFAALTKSNVNTVKVSLNRLEELGYIKRITTVITNKGKANRQRKIILQKRGKSAFHPSF